MSKERKTIKHKTTKQLEDEIAKIRNNIAYLRQAAVRSMAHEDIDAAKLAITNADPIEQDKEEVIDEGDEGDIAVPKSVLLREANQLLDDHRNEMARMRERIEILERRLNLMTSEIDDRAPYDTMIPRTLTSTSTATSSYVSPFFSVSASSDPQHHSNHPQSLRIVSVDQHNQPQATRIVSLDNEEKPADVEAKRRRLERSDKDEKE